MHHIGAIEETIKKLAHFLQSTGPSYQRRRQGSGQKEQVDVFDFISLVQAWPQIIGQKLAEHTIPVKNSHKVLTILTSHSVFNDQLSYMGEELKNKIITYFPQLKGQLKEVRFQCNPLFFKQKKEAQIVVQKKSPPQKKLHPFSPEYKKLKQEALEALGEIEDLELKEQLISIYIQSSI